MRWLGKAQDGDDGAVKAIVETLREGARTSRQLDRIAQRHFLE